MLGPAEKIQFNLQLQKKIDHLPRFQPALPILGGHGQTLLGHFLISPAILNSHEANHRELVRLELPDGDELVGWQYFASQRNSPLAIAHVFHGLAGSTESKYMPRVARALCAVGLNTILWNHRGCGDGRSRAIGTYHSGRSDDLSRTVAWGRKRFLGLPQIIVGYSLSGNAATLLSAGIIPSHSTECLSQAELIDRFRGDLPDLCIAVNPPIDLQKSAIRLSHSGSRIYGQRFMIDLIQCLEERELMSIESACIDRASLQKLAGRARRTLRPWNTVFQFDQHYTGIAAGFKDHIDYYNRASCWHALGLQQVPLIMLTADDDPITHGLSDVPENARNFPKNSLVIDRQTSGGHMGFVDNEVLVNSKKMEVRWLERRLQFYVDQYLKVYLNTN